MSRCAGHGDAGFAINAPRGPASKSNDKHTHTCAHCIWGCLWLSAGADWTGPHSPQVPRQQRCAQARVWPACHLICSADQTGEQRKATGQQARAPESFLNTSWGEPGWGLALGSQQSACACILVGTNPEPPSPHISPAFNSLFLNSSFPLSLSDWPM